MRRRKLLIGSGKRDDRLLNYLIRRLLLLIPVFLAVSLVIFTIIHLVPGDRVTHDTFGLGTVVQVEGEGEKAMAHVDFRDEGTKRLLLRYAPVEKL